MPLLYTYLGKNVSSINYLQKDQNCFYKSLRFSTAIAALDDLCVRKIIQNSQTSDTPWNLLSGYSFQKKKTLTLKKKSKGFYTLRMPVTTRSVGLSMKELENPGFSIYYMQHVCILLDKVSQCFHYYTTP